MGEYAKRKSDGVEIKIGTCEDMYYLRYEDRHKVSKLPNSLDPVKYENELRFRLPFPDEDAILPGQYDDYKRGQRLYKQICHWHGTPTEECKASHGHQVSHEEFVDESSANEPGNIQLRHESGLLLNVPCYHGLKLPEVTAPMKAFWNGKSWSMELYQLRPTPEGVKPVVSCRHCGGKWRYNWSDIWEYVPGADLRAALRVYVEAEQAMAVSK